MSTRGLRAALVIAGCLPTATGLASMARGTSIVRNAGPVAPNVDSEHRYYAAFWTALGPLLWHTSVNPERHRTRIDAIAATVFAGGAARLLSARQAGRPQPLYLALAAAELVLPVATVGWQRGWWTAPAARR